MTDQAGQAARWALVCDVLDAVLDAPAADRERILEERCAGDPSLRDEVRALLRSGGSSNEHLETPLLERAGALLGGDDEPDERSAPADPPPGGTIGPWRLIEELGRGGMGAVWLAERADGAFEHRVALKLLKRGLDSDAILERFLAERQILARLQHPNIAHLVDGGVAADGRPYFAMERVQGEPLTRWCDARRLPVRERLRLFLSVIDAVQYAHRQLVVHRDLKPSNILVTADGEAKLLDFGIAKLLDARSQHAEAQTLTQLGIRMLTLEYAAPEQLRGEAVTTATDVYALGVLLYELLSGHRPPPAQADPAAGKLPPRPSTRVAEADAEARGSTRDRLRRALRGDLDTIVLRAVHPAPERRYGSAEALGADIRRHLDRLPVQARPDSIRYRAGRFVSRNRLGVAAAALLLLTLVGGIVATTWQAREARQQAARAEQVKDFLVTVFEAGSPQQWRGKEATARELLDQGAKRADEELSANPALHAEMLAVIGSLYAEQGLLQQAEALLDRSLRQRKALFGEEDPAYADSLARQARLRYRKAQWDAAEAPAARALAIYRNTPGHLPDVAAVLGTLSALSFAKSDLDTAIRLRQEALAINRRVHGDLDATVAEDLRFLGLLLVEKERYVDAQPLLEEAVRINEALYGPDSVRYAMALNRKGNLLHYQGELATAASAYERSAEIFRRAGDNDNRQRALQDYGIVLCRTGRYREGERVLRTSLALLRAEQPAESQFVALRLVSLGSCLSESGRYEEGEALLRRGASDLRARLGPAHGWSAFAARALAESLVERKQFADALPWAEQALSHYRKKFGMDSGRTSDSLRVLSGAQYGAGRREAAFESARSALSIMSKIQGPSHPASAVAGLNLARLELESGRWREAAARLAAVAPVFDSSGDAPRAATARMLWGIALAHLGQPARAGELLHAAASRRRALYGTGNPKTVEAENALRLARSAPPDGRRPQR